MCGKWQSLRAPLLFKCSNVQRFVQRVPVCVLSFAVVLCVSLRDTRQSQGSFAIERTVYL